MDSIIYNDMMECRIVLRHIGLSTEVGMFDPITERYVPLGAHREHLNTVVRDLKQRMEQAGHRVSFSEQTTQRAASA